MLKTQARIEGNESSYWKVLIVFGLHGNGREHNLKNMTYRYAIKERLKFSIRLLIGGAVLGALITGYFWCQKESEIGQNVFFLSASITGAVALGSLELVIYFFTTLQSRRRGEKNSTRAERVPWWILNNISLILCIGAMGFFILRVSMDNKSGFDLIREGYLITLQDRIIANPALLQQTEFVEGTLIQMAFSEAYPKAVELLLKNGAKVEGMDLQGRDPIVVSLGNLPLLSVLLDGDLDLNQPDSEGIPPIHHAITSHATEAFIMLIDAGAKIDSLDKLSCTPLLCAVENDELPMVKILLKKGADMNGYDSFGDTALHKATCRKDAECVQFLLKHDADPRIFNRDQMTPLHLAVIAGDMDLVALFLEIPNMIGLHGENGLTPLSQALRARNYNVATLLIKNGADINRILANGNPLICRSILDCDYRTARFLIRAGGGYFYPKFLR